MQRSCTVHVQAKPACAAGPGRVFAVRPTPDVHAGIARQRTLVWVARVLRAAAALAAPHVERGPGGASAAVPSRMGDVAGRAVP
eukprot:72880-Chlamydomonas_euryale.AAC.2